MKMHTEVTLMFYIFSSSNITQVVLQEPSPPSAKKANSLRSVRFKDDDDSKQDSQPQLLPKKICHNDGKVNK